MPKCERCGWKHGGFHVCVDLSVPHPQEARWVRYKKKPKKREKRLYDNVSGSWNDMPNYGGTRAPRSRRG